MKISSNNNLENIIYKIKNMIRLSIIELDYIKTLSPAEKYELIILYNKIAVDRYNMLLLNK